ncbi:hypothetical protein F4778DRAFT_791399 [Xylariomycetidae sp. FL2044]|nr:hypothetical protein F4778DRAFT_791399 [Xylariomycetidae sp. FL2044]
MSPHYLQFSDLQKEKEKCHQTPSRYGKVAIITGSGRENGLGAGMAKALARNGASVAINYISESTGASAARVAEALAAEYGVKTTVVRADITTPEGASLLAQKTLEAFAVDHIDILINNAGCFVIGGTLDTPPEAIHKQFNTNVFGATYMVRAVVPHMPPGSRIINVSSVYSKLNPPSVPFYNAAKAAADSLMYTWAMEFGRSHGITVNSIGVGPVQTDMEETFARDNPDGYKAIQTLVDLTRAGDRLGQIEDVADAVLLLVQEKARWISGQYVDVAGGITGN